MIEIYVRAPTEWELGLMAAAMAAGVALALCLAGLLLWRERKARRRRELAWRERLMDRWREAHAAPPPP